MHITTGLGRRNARGEGQIGKLSQDINIRLIRHVGDAMRGPGLDVSKNPYPSRFGTGFTRNEGPSVADHNHITFFSRIALKNLYSW